MTLFTKILIHCITLFVFAGSVYSYADWVRISFLPLSYQDDSEYTTLYDGDVILNWRKYTNSNIYAFVWVYSEIIWGNHSATPVRGFGTTWTETYSWSGGNPPSNFQWNWRGSASHYCTARVYDTTPHFDQAEGFGWAQLSVTVPSGSGSSSASSPLHNAAAKSVDGSICAINTYTGLTCSYISGELASCVGTTAYCSQNGFTSGSGPYQRISKIDYIAAQVILNGDDEWGSTTEEASFGLPW